MQDTYHGSTVDELRQVRGGRRAKGLADQGSLFEHSGSIILTDDTLELGHWMTLQPVEIAAVQQEFIPEYNRLRAGGARGGFPSLGLLRRAGAPILITLASEVQLVLIIGFHLPLGTTHNSQWLPELRRFAGL